MTTSRTSSRGNPTRRGRLAAVLAGLLAVGLAWAPGAVAAAGPAGATHRAVQATAADSAAREGHRDQGVSAATLSPGDPIFSSGARCTVGFNVTDGGDVFILTAGHCTSAGSYWYADPQHTIPVGPTVASSFPGNDFGLIRYDDPELVTPGEYTAGYASVGQPVYIVSPGTGIHSGTVTGLNATVNYGPDGIVYGLIQTNICLPPGMGSGTPLFGSGDTALGIAVGGSGSCTSGGTSFFQPVTEALSMYGLVLY